QPKANALAVTHLFDNGKNITVFVPTRPEIINKLVADYLFVVVSPLLGLLRPFSSLLRLTLRTVATSPLGYHWVQSQVRHGSICSPHSLPGVKRFIPFYFEPGYLLLLQI